MLVDDSLDTQVVEQIGIDFLHVTDVEDSLTHLNKLTGLQL